MGWWKDMWDRHSRLGEGAWWSSIPRIVKRFFRRTRKQRYLLLCDSYYTHSLLPLCHPFILSHQHTLQTIDTNHSSQQILNLCTAFFLKITDLCRNVGWILECSLHTFSVQDCRLSSLWGMFDHRAAKSRRWTYYSPIMSHYFLFVYFR